MTVNENSSLFVHACTPKMEYSRIIMDMYKAKALRDQNIYFSKNDANVAQAQVPLRAQTVTAPDSFKTQFVGKPWKRTVELQNALYASAHNFGEWSEHRAINDAVRVAAAPPPLPSAFMGDSPAQVLATYQKRRSMFPSAAPVIIPTSLNKVVERSRGTGIVDLERVTPAEIPHKKELYRGQEIEFVTSGNADIPLHRPDAPKLSVGVTDADYNRRLRNTWIGALESRRDAVAEAARKEDAFRRRAARAALAFRNAMFSKLNTAPKPPEVVEAMVKDLGRVVGKLETAVENGSFMILEKLTEEAADKISEIAVHMTPAQRAQVTEWLGRVEAAANTRLQSNTTNTVTADALQFVIAEIGTCKTVLASLQSVPPGSSIEDRVQVMSDALLPITQGTAQPAAPVAATPAASPQIRDAADAGIIINDEDGEDGPDGANSGLPQLSNAPWPDSLRQGEPAAAVTNFVRRTFGPQLAAFMVDRDIPGRVMRLYMQRVEGLIRETLTSTGEYLDAIDPASVESPVDDPNIDPNIRAGIIACNDALVVYSDTMRNITAHDLEGFRDPLIELLGSMYQLADGVAGDVSTRVVSPDLRASTLQSFAVIIAKAGLVPLPRSPLSTVPAGTPFDPYTLLHQVQAEEEEGWSGPSNKKGPPDPGAEGGPILGTDYEFTEEYVPRDIYEYLGAVDGKSSDDISPEAQVGLYISAFLRMRDYFKAALARAATAKSQFIRQAVDAVTPAAAGNVDRAQEFVLGAANMPKSEFVDAIQSLPRRLTDMYMQMRDDLEDFARRALPDDFRLNESGEDETAAPARPPEAYYFDLTGPEPVMRPRQLQRPKKVASNNFIDLTSASASSGPSTPAVSNISSSSSSVRFVDSLPKSRASVPITPAPDVRRTVLNTIPFEVSPMTPPDAARDTHTPIRINDYTDLDNQLWADAQEEERMRQEAEDIERNEYANRVEAYDDAIYNDLVGNNSSVTETSPALQGTRGVVADTTVTSPEVAQRLLRLEDFDEDADATLTSPEVKARAQFDAARNNDEAEAKAREEAAVAARAVGSPAEKEKPASETADAAAQLAAVNELIQLQDDVNEWINKSLTLESRALGDKVAHEVTKAAPSPEKPSEESTREPEKAPEEPEKTAEPAKAVRQKKAKPPTEPSPVTRAAQNVALALEVKPYLSAMAHALQNLAAKTSKEDKPLKRGRTTEAELQDAASRWGSTKAMPAFQAAIVTNDVNTLRTLYKSMHEDYVRLKSAKVPDPVAAEKSEGWYDVRKLLGLRHGYVASGKPPSAKRGRDEFETDGYSSCSSCSQPRAKKSRGVSKNLYESHDASGIRGLVKGKHYAEEAREAECSTTTHGKSGEDGLNSKLSSLVHRLSGKR